MNIIRTNSGNTDFQGLVVFLNQYLKTVDGDDHEFYHQFNGIEKLQHVVVVNEGDKAVSCGAMKPFGAAGMEIKRMYTVPEYRGKGLARMILNELESWAAELGKSSCVLETGKRQVEAVKLYEKYGYERIPNFDPYEQMDNSLCFEKVLDANQNSSAPGSA